MTHPEIERAERYGGQDPAFREAFDGVFPATHRLIVRWLSGEPLVDEYHEKLEEELIREAKHGK